MIEYGLVQTTTGDELPHEVNRWIKEGWRPQGGPVMGLAGGYVWHQAMVRDVPDRPRKKAGKPE